MKLYAMHVDTGLDALKIFFKRSLPDPNHDWVVVCFESKNMGVTLLNGMEAHEPKLDQTDGDGGLKLVVNSMIMMPGTQGSDW